MKRLADDENNEVLVILSGSEGSHLFHILPTPEERSFAAAQDDNVTCLPVPEDALEYRDEERY
jgi:hypothetical protein